MTVVYRLHSSRHPASSGDGAALHGGRWNHKGTPVIYASASVALCALEVLVNYSVLPKGFVASPITIPASLRMMSINLDQLPESWDSDIPSTATRDLGKRWIDDGKSAILRVPSVVVKAEFNYVINVRHPDFGLVEFGEPEPFQFDPRLRG